MGNNHYTVMEDIFLTIMVNQGRLKAKEMAGIINQVFPVTRTSKGVEVRVSRLRNPLTPANHRSIKAMAKHGISINPALPKKPKTVKITQDQLIAEIREQVKEEIMEELRAGNMDGPLARGLGLNPAQTSLKGTHGQEEVGK